MPVSALQPEAAVERLDAMSSEVRAAVLFDERGELTARAGVRLDDPARAGELVDGLFEAADVAGRRTGVESVDTVEVSRPGGGVFGMRRRDRGGNLWTLVAVTAAGALASLVLYDLRMTLLAMEPA